MPSRTLHPALGSRAKVKRASSPTSASSPANADNRVSKPSNRGRTDLSYTMKMERIDGCRVIRFPRPVNIHEDNGIPKEFTAHQVHMMRALLTKNGVDLSQFAIADDATDEEKRSMALTIAKTYNATLAEQKRKIIKQYKRAPRFTFDGLEWWCYPICKLKGFECGPGHELFYGCTSHDLVKYPMDDDERYECLSVARGALMCSHLGYTPEGQLQCVPWVIKTVCKSMQGILEEVTGYVYRYVRTPSEIYETKFLSLDAQYKVLHCLLIENNPIVREIKANKEHWEQLETLFMKVFKEFDQHELWRLATDDGGVWCDMFDFVCEWAEKEGIMPRLNEARKKIAEAVLTQQDGMAIWVKRLKGSS
ncbi:hypothetical protein B0T20DRAFT_84894 [Sordaria brevicollis]|uniref:Uncharacterized protein n=1 Tax=Sordaria brevicollis TaxID=83679 RepID=A0AAE0P1L2_SORBR|nr:hypothetical protein B0T20DRAFT_84894 [Sordaria brevicollis]